MNYKEVLDELRESNKEWVIASMYDAKVMKEGSGIFFFDIHNWLEECYFEFGECPEEMAIDAVKNFDMSGIDKEGYWNVTHLLKYSPADYFEGRLTEHDYFEIVYTEVQFICTIEQRQTDEAANKGLFGNEIF